MSVEPIGNTMRLLIGGARKIAGGQSGLSQLDRNLAAATLVGVAVVVAWPRDRKLPKLVTRARRLGQQVYDRREWWIAPRD
jgi:hypothetical protein